MQPAIKLPLITPPPKNLLDLPRDHISVSQIRMYLRCPAQYYFHYVENIKVPSSGPLVLGKAVHAALEYYFWEKIFIGTGAQLDDVLDVYSEAFEKERLDAVWGDEDPSKAKDEGAELIKLYLTETAPQVIPLAVEKKFEVPIAGTVLLGYIDLITTDGKIIDHKVVSKTPSENKIKEDIQLTAYAMAYRELFGELPLEVKLNYMVRNKVPKLVERAANRGEEDIRRFIHLAEGVVKAIGAGMFYPNPDNSMCSPNCGYWDECHK
jgi:CRISPR/Cas system-associated exonuclease Cas4 (RecB family)